MSNISRILLVALFGVGLLTGLAGCYGEKPPNETPKSEVPATDDAEKQQ